MRRGVIFAAVALLLAAAPGASEVRVVRFVVEQTRTSADGASFGSVETYQRFDRTAYMEVDPFAEDSGVLR